MTRPPTERGADEWTVVRLSDVDRDLRIAVAHELASHWRLRGLEYARWMLRVVNPSGDRDAWIEVPVEKARIVAAGKRPPGTLSKDMKVRPGEFRL